MHTYKNLKLADNAIGYTHASGNIGRSAFTSRVVDSLFVGETENIGNPRTPAEMAYGRSLPEPKVPDFPIRAYEFYDYRHELDNVTFVNFQDNATRKTGAISYLLFTSFGMSSNNTVQRAKFVNAKPVYFPPMEYKWSNDDYGSGSYKSSVFHDKDGSVGGVPNSFIVINGGIAHRRSLRDQAHLERCGVQGRCRAHEYWRRRRRPWWRSAVVATLVRSWRTWWSWCCRWTWRRWRSQARLPALAALVALLLPAAGARWWSRLAQLLQVLRSRQSFSASTARISPSPVQPTYERAPSTR